MGEPKKVPPPNQGQLLNPVTLQSEPSAQEDPKPKDKGQSIYIPIDRRLLLKGLLPPRFYPLIPLTPQTKDLLKKLLAKEQPSSSGKKEENKETFCKKPLCWKFETAKPK